MQKTLTVAEMDAYYAERHHALECGPVGTETDFGYGEHGRIVWCGATRVRGDEVSRTILMLTDVGGFELLHLWRTSASSWLHEDSIGSQGRAGDMATFLRTAGQRIEGELAFAEGYAACEAES